MAPKNKIIGAVALMGVGLMPFVYSEVSFWIWESQLDPKNNVGFTDAMLIGAMRTIALLLSVLVSGIGLAWALYLGRRHPDVLRGIRRFATGITAITLGVPFIWYVGNLVAT